MKTQTTSFDCFKLLNFLNLKNLYSKKNDKIINKHLLFFLQILQIFLHVYSSQKEF